MEIKKDAKITISRDFFYALFDSREIDPIKVLVDKQDQEKVVAAIEIINQFQLDMKAAGKFKFYC